MTEEEQIELVKAGKNAWNAWRKENHRLRVDFGKIDFDGYDLQGYDFSHCYFSGSSLRGCNLNETELTWSGFFHTNFSGSTFLNPILDTYAGDKRWMGVNIRWSSFADCDMRNVKMAWALFEAVHLHDCDLRGADISNSQVNGISFWGNKVDETTLQTNLIITGHDEPVVTVDNVAFAQYLHLLINNKNIRDAIDAMASKVVLILGSFASGDIEILQQIKLGLNRRGYIPVLFDFAKPSSRNLTETVATLGHLSRFIIADLTHPRSIPHELANLIPHMPSVPVIPILQEGVSTYSMFNDYGYLQHVAAIHPYKPDAIEPLMIKIFSIEKEIQQKIAGYRGK